MGNIKYLLKHKKNQNSIMIVTSGEYKDQLIDSHNIPKEIDLITLKTFIIKNQVDLYNFKIGTKFIDLKDFQISKISI